MIFRDTYLENALPLADSGERTVDINVIDPITCLWIELRATNGAARNVYNPMHGVIDTLEIIDGSTVLYSMDGRQALALACAQLGYMPNQRFTALGGDPASAALPILFGRYIGDREYAFDPSKFVNPQLRIRWNLAAVRAIGADSYVNLSARLTIIARVMEGATAPRAMLMAKENYTWVPAVGTEYVDLPRDYPYVGLMYRSVLVAHHPYDIVSNVRLNCDSGKVIPFDLRVENLIYMMNLTQPKLEYRESAHVLDGETLYTYLEELEDVALVPENGGADYVLGYRNYEYGSGPCRVHIAGAAGVANVGVHCHGYCPFGYIYIPFGDPKVPSDWFQSKSFGSVRFEATGIHAGTAALCLVQDRPY
jgi:hypothetical protein